MIESAREKQAREHFESVTAEHEMTVLHDEGLYRHLRFAAPGTWIYGYDLVTWPGHLAINGDLDSGYTFARLDDMIQFFASESKWIDFRYWAEKLTCSRTELKVYSPELLDWYVQNAANDLADAAFQMQRDKGEWLAAWEEHSQFVERDDERGAREAVESFSARGYGFGPDIFEWELRDWHPSFLTACFAIRAGVDQYRASMATEVAA